MRYLLQLGADPDSGGEDRSGNLLSVVFGVGVLHLSDKRTQKIAKILIRAGADVNYNSDNEFACGTPLLDCVCNRPKLLPFLLQHQIKPPKSWSKVLEAAIVWNRPSAMEVLCRTFQIDLNTEVLPERFFMTDLTGLEVQLPVCPLCAAIRSMTYGPYTQMVLVLIRLGSRLLAHHVADFTCYLFPPWSLPSKAEVKDAATFVTFNKYSWRSMMYRDTSPLFRQHGRRFRSCTFPKANNP